MLLKGFAMYYRAISKRGSQFEVFEERFTLVCLILKHGDPVGNQRIVGLFYQIYSNKLYLSSTSNVCFPLRWLLALLICQSRQNLVTILHVLLFSSRKVNSQMQLFWSQCRALYNLFLCVCAEMLFCSMIRYWFIYSCGKVKDIIWAVWWVLHWLLLHIVKRNQGWKAHFWLLRWASSHGI